MIKMSLKLILVFLALGLMVDSQMEMIQTLISNYNCTQVFDVCRNKSMAELDGNKPDCTDQLDYLDCIFDTCSALKDSDDVNTFSKLVRQLAKANGCAFTVDEVSPGYKDSQLRVIRILISNYNCTHVFDDCANKTLAELDGNKHNCTDQLDYLDCVFDKCSALKDSDDVNTFSSLVRQLAKDNGCEFTVDEVSPNGRVTPHPKAPRNCAVRILPTPTWKSLKTVIVVALMLKCLLPK